MPMKSSGWDKSRIIEAGKKALETEIAGLQEVVGRLDGGFTEAIELLFSIKGRVVVTGIGKSGLIGRKIAATFSSTGTPAIFLHPVEAMHGDLGVVSTGDVVIAISNSGETQELNALLPVFKDRNVPVIALTGNPASTLGRSSQVVVNTCVSKEACGLGLAPTASTTAALAMGDAMAVVLLEMRHFNEKDFLRNHPAGTLGERLKVQVKEVMLTGENLPLVRTGSIVADMLKELDAKGLGAVLVLDGDETLAGIVTDGDIRRALIKYDDLPSRNVDEVMTRNPKSIMPETMAAEALELMEKHLITVLPVIEIKGKLVGIVHLHDLLGKGQFRFVV